MKKVLITGFTGQVGSQLAEFLLSETNSEVYGLMRWQEDQRNISAMTSRINAKDRVYVEYGDLNDFSSLCRIMSSIKPDLIFHLGAQSFPKTSFDIPIETLQTNILGTANLLEAVRQSRREKYNPIIHVCSSSEVYGRAPSGVLLNEQTELHGASPYSISKIGTDFLGRFYAEAYGLRTFITRMGTHSGPRRSDVFFESTVAKQIALIERGFQEPVLKLGNLNSVRTFQDVRDAVRAYFLLSCALAEDKIAPGEVFNIAGEEKFVLHEVVELMISMSTTKGISIVQDESRMRPIDADYQMFDNTKLRSVIDWKPTIPAKQMFLELLEFWRDEINNGSIPLDR